MVLAELGKSITDALQCMSNKTVVDQKAFTDCLNKIVHVLILADVRFASVQDLHAKVLSTVDFASLPTGVNKRRVIEQAVFAELCRMLDPGTPPPFAPVRGRTATKAKPYVVMFVGLQGSGKTTTCAKYADYHRRKGFSPALVCADTFRAGAFDQLKQNAARAGIPYYGSYVETDPVRVADDGVRTFRDGRQHDLIVVDTSGRHRQEAALFEEMRQLSEAVRPDLVVLVMDASIGQAAFDQARAFKQIVPVGTVIITKTDGHAKGGGALSAVAATKAPVIFIGTGERIDQFEEFKAEAFVKRLLGFADPDELVNAMPAGLNPEELA